MPSSSRLQIALRRVIMDLITSHIYFKIFAIDDISIRDRLFLATFPELVIDLVECPCVRHPLPLGIAVPFLGLLIRILNLWSLYGLRQVTKIDEIWRRLTPLLSHLQSLDTRPHLRLLLLWLLTIP